MATRTPTRIRPRKATTTHGTRARSIPRGARLTSEVEDGRARSRGSVGAHLLRLREPENSQQVPGAGTRSEDPVIADEVEARRRDQSGDPLQELEGLEDDVGRAAPAVLEAVEEAPVVEFARGARWRPANGRRSGTGARGGAGRAPGRRRSRAGSRLPRSCSAPPRRAGDLRRRCDRRVARRAFRRAVPWRRARPPRPRRAQRAAAPRRAADRSPKDRPRVRAPGARGAARDLAPLGGRRVRPLRPPAAGAGGSVQLHRPSSRRRRRGRASGSARSG